MAITAARMGLLMALALNTVNQQQPQARVNPPGLSMCPDSIHRDTVFINLQAAMTAAGLTQGDILREKAALDAAIDAGQGYMTQDMETQAYIYNPGNTQFNFESPQEKNIFTQFVEYFKQIKSCIGGTLQLIKGMNLWEQINALLLASGLVTFTTQCINLGKAVGSCAYDLGTGFVGMSYEFAKYVIKKIPGRIQNKDSVNEIVSANKITNNPNPKFKDIDIIKTLLNDIISKIELSNEPVEKERDRYGNDESKPQNPQIITRENSLKAFIDYISNYHIDETSIGYDMLINIAKMFGIHASQLSTVVDIGYDTDRETINTHKRSNISQEPILPRPYFSLPYGGRPRTKRRRNNKTKSKTKSKRRRYKTKKRVYRSTRFASRK